MRSNPERLAWIVLLASFFICLGLAVAIPLGTRSYVLTASEAQNVTLEVSVQRGSLRVTLPGRGEPIAIAEKRDEIPERTFVATDSNTGRLVMHTPEEDHSVIATAQLYANTEIVLASARSPRFSVSRLPHRVVLELETGRARINVFSHNGRATIVEIQTPHGKTRLIEGSYEIKVGTATEVSVHHGQAEVVKEGFVTRLNPNERAIVDDEQVAGPSPVARNLIANGDFTDSLEETWSRYSKDVEFEGEPGGEAQRTEIEGQPVVVIVRRGRGHAETGISQQLDADIRDLSFLQLHLKLRIEGHDVPVCGSQGSECPVMVRINYQDANGVDQEWLQGFYVQPDTSGFGNPSVCVTCSTRNPHIQARESTWYPYLSDNLIPLLSQDGKAPTAVTSITIYASGHSYHSMVTEVELIGQE